MSQYITLKEAAKISGYHQDYLGQLIRSGKLRGRKIGKDWLTTQSALFEYLRSQNRKPLGRAASSMRWWQYRVRVVLGTAVFVAVVGGTFFSFWYSDLRVTIAQGNDTGDEQRVVITNEDGAVSKEVTVTTYALDDDSQIHVSVSSD